MANLLIISHTEHYYSDGVYYGWGATVREISHLATLFDKVVHVAPVHDVREMNKNALPYAAGNIRVRPVHPSGGRTLMSKLGILAAIPEYVRVIRDEIRRADVVHVRCPANISLIALFLLIFPRKDRKLWLKYAGNWRPGTIFPLSYFIQRWLLQRILVNAVVTVNGTGEGDPPHVVSILNPSLTDEELCSAKEAATEKKPGPPYRFVFVGRTEAEKGIGQALEIVKAVEDVLGEVHLDVVGDGPERGYFEEYAAELGMADRVTFHGWLARNELNKFYSQAHILLLPSKTEGWPKVVGEAMAFGCVPVCSNVSSIGHHLARFRTGAVVERDASEETAGVIRALLSDPLRWISESANASIGAGEFTYWRYLERMQALLGMAEQANGILGIRAEITAVRGEKHAY